MMAFFNYYFEGTLPKHPKCDKDFMQGYCAQDGQQVNVVFRRMTNRFYPSAFCTYSLSQG